MPLIYRNLINVAKPIAPGSQSQCQGDCRCCLCLCRWGSEGQRKNGHSGRKGERQEPYRGIKVENRLRRQESSMLSVAVVVLRSIPAGRQQSRQKHKGTNPYYFAAPTRFSCFLFPIL